MIKNKNVYYKCGRVFCMHLFACRLTKWWTWASRLCAIFIYDSITQSKGTEGTQVQLGDKEMHTAPVSSLGTDEPPSSTIQHSSPQNPPPSQFAKSTFRCLWEFSMCTQSSFTRSQNMRTWWKMHLFRNGKSIPEKRKAILWRSHS